MIPKSCQEFLSFFLAMTGNQGIFLNHIRAMHWTVGKDLNIRNNLDIVNIVNMLGIVNIVKIATILSFVNIEN